MIGDLAPVNCNTPSVIDPAFAPEPGCCPVVVSYGGGVDSTAMLVGLESRGLRPHMILFAHVGNEWPETYEFLPIVQKWLKGVGFPPITVVQYQPKKFLHGEYHDLYGNCFVNHTLPSISFGRKSCSLKWKASALDAYVRNCEQCATWLAGGGQVRRLIGYDAGPRDKCRGAVKADPHLWEYQYPLREWGWDRDQCSYQIKKAGLPPVHKSACYFCASTQKHEVRELAENHRDLLLLALKMEDNARPYLKGCMTQEELDTCYEHEVAEYGDKMRDWEWEQEHPRVKGRKTRKPAHEPQRRTVGDPGLVKGLWRRDIKGTRKPESKRPGSWREFCEQEGLLKSLEQHGYEMFAKALIRAAQAIHKVFDETDSNETIKGLKKVVFEMGVKAGLSEKAAREAVRVFVMDY